MLVAAVTTVVTLLYLSVQIRHSSKIAAAQSQRELLNTSIVWEALRDPQMISVLQRGFTNFEALSNSDKVLFHTWIHPMGNRIEAAFRMYRQGYLEKASYLGFRNVWLSILATTGGTEWWAISGTLFGADFVEEMDASAESERGSIQPWTSILPYFVPDE